MTDYPSVQTKWNFDEERMKALSTYMALTEDAFAEFTSYKGMKPIENLFGCLSVLKRAILGTGAESDDKDLIDEFKELEKIKRECNLLLLEEQSNKKVQQEFVIKSVEFLNKAEGIWIKINRLNVKNGFYFRRKDDPRRAVEMY